MSGNNADRICIASPCLGKGQKDVEFNSYFTYGKKQKAVVEEENEKSNFI